MVHEYIINSICYMLCSIPIYLIVRSIILCAKKDAIKNWLHEIVLLFFVIYCVGLASQTIIPKIEFGNTSNFIVSQNIFGDINYIPGKIFYDTYHQIGIENNYNYLFVNAIGNICLFIPMGFFISAIWKNLSVKKIIIITLSLSLCIELLQLPQARGTDIDDLWLNLLGGLIGYWIYILLLRVQSFKCFLYKL